MKREVSLLNAFLESRGRHHINILRLASAVVVGQTLAFGAYTFEATSSGNVTAGNIAVNIGNKESFTAAAKILTFASNVAAADTITIGTQTYTFRTALTTSATANEVLIGADLTASRDNLVAAVMRAAGAGTLYGSDTTANTAATAVATSTDQLTATAITKGTVGNSVAIAEVSTHTSWAGGAVTLSGGTDTSASDFNDALVAAVNTSSNRLAAEPITANEVLFVDLNNPTNAVACTETLAGANNTWANATSYGGEGVPLEVPASSMISRSPNATEVALESMHFKFRFAVRSAIVQVRTTAGLIKAIDAAITIDTNRVTITSSGATDLVATDTVTVLASE